MFSVRTICRTLLLGAAVTLPSLTPALAYSTDGDHWTYNRTVVMDLSLGEPRPLQDGFNSFNESAADALRMWNQVLVHMQFGWRIASPLPPSDADYDNSVEFSNTVFGDAFGKNVLAVTVTSRRGNITSESDVVFNSAEQWDSYRGPRQPGPEDFRRVALHEFGHVLGLDHPDDAGQSVSAIMNSRISNIETLQSDDVNGARSLYDNGPPYRAMQPSNNLINLSTRGYVSTGDNVMIGGFAVQGPDAMTVVLRAIGGSLAASSVSSPLHDPIIELRNSNGVLVAQNDDWIDSPDAETIASYRLDPTNSLESAVLRTLSPGNYTALVRSFDNGDGVLSGTALFELFDLHTTNGRAINISTRAQVLTGDQVMIAGFVIGGSQPKEVVVRGIGPSLLDSNVSGALLDPTIELRNSSGQVVASNDNWESDPNAARVRAVNLAPRRSPESALDRTLPAGGYTVIMRGVNASTGVGLIEVYEIAP